MNTKDTKIVIFKNKKVRKTLYRNEWWFSVIDVIEAVTESERPRKYWADLKKKLVQEGYSQLSEKIGQLKLPSSDGKRYETDCADTETIFRIVQSIPSPKAEPFKRWLAKVGYERVQEIENPELATKRTRMLYKLKGYSEDWIEKRMRGIAIRQIQSLAAKCLTVDIASMRNSDKLYRTLVYKSEKHAPVASDTKGQIAEQRFRKMFGVQKRIVRVPLQTLDQFNKLATMFSRENSSAFQKSGMKDDFKHPLFVSQQETLWHLRSGIAVSHSQYEESSGRIPDGIRPRGLYRRCLSRTSGACALLFREMQWSYCNDTPTKQKINEKERPPIGI